MEKAGFWGQGTAQKRCRMLRQLQFRTVVRKTNKGGALPELFRRKACGNSNQSVILP